MSGKVPMTREGHESLTRELRRLKIKERPKIINEIAIAREHGDLS
jgi:transcription elongation factor GreA